MSDVATSAIDNSITYYENTQRYNIAVAGANLACNQIFMDNTWREGFSDMDFNGGVVNVTCYDSASGKVLITSTGTYQSTTSEVKVLLSPSSFSKFAMYCGNVSAAAKLRDGDTINGPIHFNNKLVTSGSPVFYGKATMGSLQTTSGTPKFLGGYESGVNIPFPDYSSNATSIKDAATSAGYYQSGGQLWVEFRSDGYVRYKTTTAGSYSAYMPLSTFASNGKICVNDGELHVLGTLSGTVTLASTVTPSTTPSATVGSTFIEDELRYATDPLTNPASTDMLGIVSAGDLTIQKMPMRIDGNLFTDQNATLNSAYRNNTPMKQIKVVGTFMSRNMNSTDFGTGTNKGANFYMKYDTRVESNPPSDFPYPTTNSFEILSWYE
ncbi:MAG: hypothetical protein HYV29_11345 [Ignavibacteriales bacterium]|nr:hypothetical protein [Ignavibacteriales bacterium]